MANAVPSSQPIVIETEDSVLYCVVHNKDWCEHIEGHIRRHADAHDFWIGKEPHESEIQEVVWSIRLPIIPSHDLWAQAGISYIGSSAWSLNLRCKHPEPSQYISVPMGLTGPGEGRAVWRSMVVDYWKAQCELDFPKCKSKGHSYRAQVQWTKALELDASDITYHLNAWTAWYHEMCWYCFRMRDNPAAFDDVVPADAISARMGNRYNYRDSGEYYGR